MTPIEWIANELLNLDIAYEMGLDKNEFKERRIEIIKKASEMQKNEIIRAVNYSIMKQKELRSEAIKQRKSIGEIYEKNLLYM